MRQQNIIAFDDSVEGTTAVYTTPAWNDQLGASNKWYLQAITSNVSGTSPTLSVQAETSPNERDWTNLTSIPEVNGVSLSASARTISAIVSGQNSLGFVRFRITLGGTFPKARVMLYVTTRDPGT